MVMAAAGDWLNGTESSAKKSHGHSCPQSDQNRYSTTIHLMLLKRYLNLHFETIVKSVLQCLAAGEEKCEKILLLFVFDKYITVQNEWS